MAKKAQRMSEVRDSSKSALFEMASGFIRGKVLCAAVRLGIADALADGPMAVDKLAAVTETNPGALHRFMRALACIGVVEEIAPDHFALTKFGEPLRKDAPNSVWASMVFWADLLADAWTYLPDCVRTGDRSGMETARQRDGVTSRWSREPDAHAIFHAVFAEPVATDFAPYVEAWDCSRCRVIADLGGGGGGFLVAVLTAQPGARGVLVERQGAIDRAANLLEASGLTGRYEVLVGDLLESVPLGADVYTMRCVLHGYDDESSLRILRNIRRAMGPQSRLLLIEALLPNRVGLADPELEKLIMSDLNMLVLTGGRERSENEWNALLLSAGLDVQRVLPVAGQTCSIIEATCGVVKDEGSSATSAASPRLPPASQHSDEADADERRDS